MGRSLLMAAALVVGLGAWLTLSPAPAPPSDGPVTRADLRYGWPEGTGYRYRLDYRSENQARPALVAGAEATTFSGTFHLAGALELRSHGPTPGGARLGLRLDTLTAVEVRVLDQELPPEATRAELLGHEALLDLDPRGRITRLSFPPTSSALFRNVTQVLVGHLWVELGAGDAWTAAAVTEHGVVETAYAREGAEGVRRRRVAYESLTAMTAPWTADVDGVAVAQVEPGGPLRAIRGHETVRARDARRIERLRGDATFSLELVERFVFDPAPPAIGLVSYAPGQLAEAPGVAADHLRQRVAGLTADELLNTLAEHGRFGAVPRHNEFLWRATGLLIQRPALCAELVALFESDAFSDKGRLLLLDLLTHAGTPEAQAALRDALRSPVAEASAKYGLMYQRISLVKRATPETVALARARYQRPGPEGASAATYTLGSVAAQAADPDERRAIKAQLERDLRGLEDEPATERRRRSLIFALGNAAAGARTIRGYVEHPHPELRYAAAAALRHQRDRESRDALVALTADAEHRVAQRAMRSLAKGDLTAAELERLLALVTARAVPEVAYHGLVNLLTPYLDDPVAQAILRHILTQELNDIRVKGRIRALLGEI